MFSDENRRELLENGYTIVEKILPVNTCDECVRQYDIWLSNFVGCGDWPFSFKSVIERYRIGHYEPTWHVRLACKPVFAELWETNKLLTSIEGVGIYRAPEIGQEEFYERGKLNLRCDQPGTRIGLHSVRGAVYLQPSSVDDWAFVFIKGSHCLMDEFYRLNPKALAQSTIENGYFLTHEDRSWFKTRGCPLTRVPVPKSGVVLWDSRTVHTIAQPLRDRKHAGRSQRVVFVSMAPAVWATEEDLQVKRVAYQDVMMTEHWPSQGVKLLSQHVPDKFKRVPATAGLPNIAKTEEAKQLCAAIPYDFQDGQPNGPSWIPKWLGTYSN